ncbi:MAG: hypothetical protein R3A52_21770 [Polyangiales bacterium]
MAALVERWADRARAHQVDAPTVSGRSTWAAPLLKTLAPLVKGRSLSITTARCGQEGRVVFEGAQGTAPRPRPAPTPS